MNQKEAVIQTIENLGGISTLGQLYQEVFKIKSCEWATKTPFASIRRIVQLSPEIYKIKPGLYGLIRFKKENEHKGIFEETVKNKNSKAVTEFNHTYYQGILLQLGSIKNFQTFVPNQDKNKIFLNKKLSDLKTLNAIPQFSYSNLVKRSSTIDVIWLNVRNMPHSFFEIEHKSDIQNSLLKFNDLQDFYVRMVIVADKARKKEYEDKIKFSSFTDLNNRVSFLDYGSLSRQYEYHMQQHQFSFMV
jgi:hypothetical protein